MIHCMLLMGPNALFAVAHPSAQFILMNLAIYWLGLISGADAFK